MNGRDFLNDDVQITNNSQFSGRDFLNDDQDQQPEESYMTSLGQAIPRVASDIGKGIKNLYQNFPAMQAKAKSEIPGMVTAGLFHPLHLAGQELAGTQEAINAIGQAPLNISSYGSERLHLTPHFVTNFLSKITPEDTSSAINQIFGAPKYPGEDTFRSAFRDIPNSLSALKGLSIIQPATKNAIKNSLLVPHDALESRASDAFKHVSNQVNKRGINKVPFESSFDPEWGFDSPDKFFEDLREYFPKTRAANALLNSAKTGDYNALRKIQSDLYKKGKQNIGSELDVDRSRGEEMFEKRNDINQAISNHLVNSGNEDLNNVLNKAREDYRTLQDVYYNKNMNNAIINMVNKDFRKIPKNLINVLSEDSIPMKKLIDFHPELQKNLGRYGSGKRALIAAGLGGGAGLGDIYLNRAGKSLANQYLDNQEGNR